MKHSLAITQQTLDALHDSLEHLTGFFLVLVVLLLLWGVTAAIGKVFILSAERQKAAAAASPVPAAAPAPSSAPAGGAAEDQAATDEEIAAVSAAVALLMHSRHRILSIRAPLGSWGQEGRRQHFASHKIR